MDFEKQAAKDRQREDHHAVQVYHGPCTLDRRWDDRGN